jgi:hypothetical protein
MHCVAPSTSSLEKMEEDRKKTDIAATDLKKTKTQEVKQ